MKIEQTNGQRSTQQFYRIEVIGGFSGWSLTSSQKHNFTKWELNTQCELFIKIYIAIPIQLQYSVISRKAHLLSTN